MPGEIPQEDEEKPGISADVARQVIADAVRAVKNPQERIRLVQELRADGPQLVAEAQMEIMESDPFYGSVPSSE